mmetsp:Transcript_6608/g.10909  ORF Transcript_6608/g.10909 Transcript_6608/m.10909 type:complete len:114 (+) Transcript_6608:104-445(+)
MPVLFKARNDKGFSLPWNPGRHARIPLQTFTHDPCGPCEGPRTLREAKKIVFSWKIENGWGTNFECSGNAPDFASFHKNHAKVTGAKRSFFSQIFTTQNTKLNVSGAKMRAQA